MALRFTFRQLEYFVAIGRAGSLSAAARRINVSAPSLSAALAQLEAEFGLPLFTRQHAQGLVLTDAGQRLMDRAAHLLEEAGALGDLANDMAERLGGPVSAGCLVTFAPLLMGPLRRSFSDAFPEARLSMQEAHQAGLLTLLDRGEIDIALTYNLDLPKTLRFDALLDLPPHAVLPPGHPLACHDSVTLAALAAEPMVLLDLPHSRDYFLSLFQTAGLRPRIAERCGGLGVMFSLVAHGFGYGLVNLRPAAPQSPDGAALRLVPITGPAPSEPVRPMVLGLARKRAVSPRIVAAFATHLRDRLQGRTLPGLAL
ncbi:LysR family transcriptional regulator [Szabonella alba]|uniref:LysR family transcriptional regulator n=1 Tax=Szabonella alba TaxID=2804194 RepID=A0A8K0XZU4_9RHOB|nr:LysR family transcriptional regulator [Szabonella alba]MBL4916413.1 LysR family transcriptional regulator [Szabonella alba]